MDIDKVRSYVCAQLPFVPFYGTDILGPVESLPESLGLQTPVLIARNPLAAIRPKSHTSASTCLEVQASGSTLAQADPTQTKESTEIRKKRSVKDHPLGAEERKRPLRLKRHTRTTPDPDSLSEPPTEAASTKRGKKRHRGKPRLPASLSFLYGFNPKNVGPSRLTVPVGDRGVFGKGRSSSATVGISLPDLTARPRFRGEPITTIVDPQLPSTPSGGGLDCNELAYPRKRQHTLGFARKITEDVRSQPEQAEGILDNLSTTWDIELEGGVLPSNSSSVSCGTTVVIDTQRIWDHQKSTTQSPQTVVDPCDQPRSLVTRSPDEYSRSSPRVASRFFPKCVSALEEDESTRTKTPGWGDCPDRGRTWDDLVHYHCTDIGWDCSSYQEIDKFPDGYCRTHLSLSGKARQEVMLDSLVEDPSPEVGYEVLSDLGTSDEKTYVFEGRRLLLGV